ncbi:MAG: AcrR family transcriptional regulator [Planctomycetota bacterium]|jgi:AcrR family transcriptional regulator
MRAIQAVAVRRFALDGFEAVTIDMVAAEAAVSPSTVYRYFGVKEQLVVWDEHDAAIEAALGQQFGKLPPFDALATAFATAYDLSNEQLAALRERAGLIDSTPALLAHQIASLNLERAALTKALTKAYRSRGRELCLDLVARIAITALLAGFERWQSSRSRKSLSTWITEAFDAARAAVDAPR